jgi:hypothetical protein
MQIEDFIKNSLLEGTGLKWKNYEKEISQIINAGLTVNHAFDFLTTKHPELKKITKRSLYNFVRKLKQSQNEVGQTSPVGQIKAVIPELIQPTTEAPPVNLQEKFKEHLANVRSENSAETIQPTESIKPKDTRPGRSAFRSTEKTSYEILQETRKENGLPNDIDRAGKLDADA